MKKSFFKKISILLLEVVSAGTIITLTSCGEQPNPYKDTKTWDSFEILTKENAELLNQIAVKQIPVYGSKTIKNAEIPTITWSEFYWEVVLYCETKMLSHEISSFAINATQDTNIKIKINNNAEYLINDKTLTKNELNRICWNVEINNIKPISWMYVNYKIVA